MTLWFDVEDLITHFRHIARPTGIQRLTFEIYREVWKAEGAAGNARFCRHGATPADYIVVDWPTLEAGILAAGAAGRGEIAAQPAESLLAKRELTGHLPEAPISATEPAPVKLNLKLNLKLNVLGKIHHFLYPRITPSAREPLGVIYRSQKRSLLAFRELLKSLLALLAKPGAPLARLGEGSIRLTTEQVKFAQGDIFVALGSSWGLLNAAAGRHVKKRYGLRFAVLIHDLIPELYPEWTARDGVAPYRAWLREVVPYADDIFAVSKHSANDLVQRMKAWNKPVSTPVVLPVGHRPRYHADLPPGADARETPFNRPFVLFVSTIEVRKNHALLFRVWRRLLDTMPAGSVPDLVFAGQVAWLTADLMVQIENANWLDGHIKLVESPSDSELVALYEACTFTVFPSLYEGWGLPVTESLSFGKTVAASNRSAIPEAGGDFCCYFDPENVDDAYNVIRSLIEHPERVRQLEAEIAAKFRPPGWADTAAALLDHLRAAKPAGQPAPDKKAAPTGPETGAKLMAAA